MKNPKTTHNKKRNSVWILTILMFSGLLGLADMSLAAEGSWTKKADMPTTRLALSTSVVNAHIIYAIGGVKNAWVGPDLSTVEAYDPATDSWTKKADMPTGRDYLSTSVVNGIIYAIGGGIVGWRVLTAVEAYDPVTDSWTKKADMPTARDSLSASVVNGIIYAIGGYDGSSTVGTVEAYDPAMDTWTKKADMSFSRWGLWTSVVNGIIYAIGGSGGLTSVEAYDPATDTWTRKPDMPTPRLDLSASAVNGKIYVIGGGTSYTAPLEKGVVEEYDQFRAPRRPPQGVNAKGKLSTLWGRLKATN